MFYMHVSIHTCMISVYIRENVNVLNLDYGDGCTTVTALNTLKSYILNGKLYGI